MRRTALAICLILSSGCLTPGDCNQYRLVWQDEFDWLDPGKWQHEITAAGGGNNEFQLYTQDGANSFTRDGKLFIKPSLLADSRNPKTGAPYGHGFMSNGVLDVAANYGSCTNGDNNGCRRSGANGDIPPVMSARLRSYQRFSFTWGRVVIRAKMPVGDWLWPAIWMLPEKRAYGGWPRSGEIDIVETIGNRDYKKGEEFIGIQKMGSTLHWGPAWDDNRWWKTHLTKYMACLRYIISRLVDDSDELIYRHDEDIMSTDNWKNVKFLATILVLGRPVRRRRRAAAADVFMTPPPPVI